MGCEVRGGCFWKDSKRGTHHLVQDGNPTGIWPVILLSRKKKGLKSFPQEGGASCFGKRKNFHWGTHSGRDLLRRGVIP